jgi:hypothetical protein
VDYLEGNGIIGGTATEMKADIIGAEKGEKYTFQYNSATVVVELYQFDLDNLNDTDKETLESIKENGTFKVLDTDVEAKISKSGKYVMLYTDSSTDDTNTAQAQKAEELFQEYDEKEDQIVVKDTDSKKDTKDESASKTEDDTAEDSSAAE